MYIANQKFHFAGVMKTKQVSLSWTLVGMDVEAELRSNMMGKYCVPVNGKDWKNPSLCSLQCIKYDRCQSLKNLLSLIHDMNLKLTNNSKSVWSQLKASFQLIGPAIDGTSLKVGNEFSDWNRLGFLESTVFEA